MLNEIFYDYPENPNLFYDSYDGNGRRWADELLYTMQQCGYIPLSEEDGRKILTKENEETFVVQVFNEMPDDGAPYIIRDLRCVSVDGALYLLLSGEAGNKLIYPEAESDYAASKTKRIVSVYKCECRQETYDEIMRYKKAVADDGYSPLGMKDRDELNLYLKNFFQQSFKKSACRFFAAFILVSVPYLFIKKYKSDAQEYNYSSTDEETASDNNTPDYDWREK